MTFASAPLVAYNSVVLFVVYQQFFTIEVLSHMNIALFIVDTVNSRCNVATFLYLECLIYFAFGYYAE